MGEVVVLNFVYQGKGKDKFPDKFNTHVIMLKSDEMGIDKPADTQYPIYDLLRQRWSPLAFSDQMVKPEKLRSVLEATGWEASSFNEQ